MYKVVIGLEVHCQLNTNSKNFSSSLNSYNSLVNTNISPTDLGYPGILPVVNKEAVRKSLKTAIALNCEIPKFLSFDRKNYLYPDLPKGYQITQMHNPIGKNGYLMINVDGVDKKVLIHDTHLEEDTANLNHYSNYSLIDYNRAGIPLLETVTEPCLYSVKEAISFLEALRSLFLYCNITEARSDKGQIRCDVNVSLMKDTDTKLGTRVEMKNINTFNNVKDALEYEIKRQTEILDNGGKIIQETRRYDDNLKMNFSMRSKEDAVDYKYFVEPNIPKIKISDELIQNIKDEIPMLQYDLVNKYINTYNISRVDANTIVKDKKIANYYDECIRNGGNPITLANFITGVILSHLNKFNLTIDKINLDVNDLNSLIKMIEEGKISNKQAKEVLTKALEEDKNPIYLVNSMNISQITSKDEILKVVREVLEENPNLVKDYHDGKRVFDYIIGQIMKKTRGRANPKLTADILREELENSTL